MSRCPISSLWLLSSGVRVPGSDAAAKVWQVDRPKHQAQSKRVEEDAGVADSGLGGQSQRHLGTGNPQAEDSSYPISTFRCWDTIINSSLWWIIKAPILLSILVSPLLTTEPPQYTQEKEGFGQKATSGFHHPPMLPALPPEQISRRAGPWGCKRESQMICL